MSSKFLLPKDSTSTEGDKSLPQSTGPRHDPAKRQRPPPDDDPLPVSENTLKFKTPRTNNETAPARAAQRTSPAVPTFLIASRRLEPHSRLPQLRPAPPPAFLLPTSASKPPISLEPPPTFLFSDQAPKAPVGAATPSTPRQPRFLLPSPKDSLTSPRPLPASLPLDPTQSRFSSPTRTLPPPPPPPKFLIPTSPQSAPPSSAGSSLSRFVVPTESPGDDEEDATVGRETKGFRRWVPTYRLATLCAPSGHNSYGRTDRAPTHTVYVEATWPLTTASGDSTLARCCPLLPSNLESGDASGLPTSSSNLIVFQPLPDLPSAAAAHADPHPGDTVEIFGLACTCFLASTHAPTEGADRDRPELPEEVMLCSRFEKILCVSENAIVEAGEMSNSGPPAWNEAE
ncbi:hypothetical protein BDK51DRAFT_43539 [Blyttiomyces helicus]|uniref:Uncharacterized protein n=1 Tax=Blyttiomyces helicus TaxID=388810 RepID=A0A4V1IRU6_9FUNG|nr:hypothetical protein BDK51DRAFT_43539 [Blyttiomyces helicus]|eukprot:RKO91287.1 hypothetical protein BDK51DRAFT_43539 [Blyttiomyces helicus]